MEGRCGSKSSGVCYSTGDIIDDVLSVARLVRGQKCHARDSWPMRLRSCEANLRVKLKPGSHFRYRRAKHHVTLGRVCVGRLTYVDFYYMIF